MLKYYNFLNEKVAADIKRNQLSVGTYVIVNGEVDDLIISAEFGKIIKMWEYGKILIEFISTFSDRLHSGYNDIGNPKRCFYVYLNNIVEILPKEISDKLENKSLLPYKATRPLAKIFKKIKFVPNSEYLDISFFDVDKEDQNLVSFISSKKFQGDPKNLKGRQTMRIGKLFKKLNPELNEVKIEELTDAYRASYRLIVLKEGLDLDVVTGEDIRYWYSNEHYKSPSNGSTLWNSCMSSPGCSVYFNLYCENPDKIALCVYLDENEKLCARALVWKLDDDEIYMDRIYSYKNEYRNILVEYANKNDMLMYGQCSKNLRVTVSKDYANKNRPEKGNPYMDTMKYMIYDNNKFILTNRPGNTKYSNV